MNTGDNIILHNSEAVNEIAIIGVSLRFPKSNSPDEFWDHLLAKEFLISEVPSDRWDKNEFFGDPRNENNKTNSIWGGFIDDADCFDASFFNISPREAIFMDPQQRIALELAWKAIEDAGYKASALKGSKTGVFMGVCNTDYGELMENISEIDAYIPSGTLLAIIANRISYWFDFKGPSISLDTACASSLVAIHQAVRSLENKDCEYALAGGVNLCWTPRRFIALSKGGMLSPDGKSKTFDKKADGYVRAEGGAILVLKPLDKAIADGDHVYAIIKGIGTNHGGRTNSLTVTNAGAQADLIRDVYEKAGVSPETVGYIETHGPGTPLGDPIEIHGLKNAFNQLATKFGKTLKESTCGLGSVKTNMGHLESAAGIAGIMKVIMALKHRTLPASIHFDQLNPLINIKESPFYIVNEAKPWPVEMHNNHPLFPRRAGVSAFGFGGSNAHIILEEYTPQENPELLPMDHKTKDSPVLIPLSAKNAERLQDYARLFLDFLCGSSHGEADLADIAYTLQVGREAMEERLIFLTKDVPELIAQVEAYLAGKEKISNYWQGQVAQGKEIISFLTQDEDSQELIHQWIVKNKVKKIAELWVKGYTIDWEIFYKEIKPQRISLPTYPFARERYWISKADHRANRIVTSPGGVAYLHPLLHQNTSNLTEQRFSSTFTGQEFFLRDHILKGQRILPGVAYLEMARVAVEMAGVVTPAIAETNDFETGQAGERTCVQLKNLVWARPIVVGEQPVQVHIGVYPEDNGEIAYEIYSGSSESEALQRNDLELLIHSKGTAALTRVSQVPTLDLKGLQDQCHQSLSSIQCYDAFREIGYNYGPGHQGIEQLFLGPGMVLAKLSLPAAVSDSKEQFVLHPSIMDAALQATIGFIMNPDDLKKAGGKASLKPLLPFAMQEFEILGSCTSKMWALIRYAGVAPDFTGKTGDKLLKFNIDLSDEQGNVWIRMKEVSLRNLEKETDASGAAASMGVLFLEPVWKEQTIAYAGSSEKAVGVAYDQYLLMLAEPGELTGLELIRESLETQMKGVAPVCRCLILQSKQKGVAERFQTYASQAFEEIRSIIKEKPQGMILIQILVSLHSERQFCSGLSGLSGLLKTAQLENPKLNGQLVEVDWPGDAFVKDLEAISAKLKENSHRPLDKQIRYQDGKRMVAGWNEMAIYPTKVGIPWKEKGVYLITGGAGGLGLIFAKEITNTAKNTTLILTGRSQLDGQKQAYLKELESLGARIEYKQVDVTKKKAVADLIQGIQKEFGSLKGIIHSAGIIRDNFILKKTKEEFQQVLAPKVSGLVNLDQASKDLPLDFFIIFSSQAGVTGNVGQADYAAANAFMDAYANNRNILVDCKQRYGKTLAMDWTLWKDGGMHMDGESEKVMFQSRGLSPMRTTTGIQALYQGLASTKTQIMVLEGNTNKLWEYIGEWDAIIHEIPKLKEISGTSTDFLKASTLDLVKQILANAVKLPPERIQLETSFERYGIDSIMQMGIIQTLEKATGGLSKTLLFEYTTLQELVDYLVKNHKDKLAATLISGKVEVSQPVTPNQGSDLDFVPLTSHKRNRFIKLPEADRIPTPSGIEDIAIVGISGRYPLANTLEELWRNLETGRNCITEAPANRWRTSLIEALSGDGSRQNGRNYYGGFLEDYDRFDHHLFEIAPDQVWKLSPEVRLFLEIVWETFEDAGYTKRVLQELQAFYQKGVGVFVGTMYNQYPWSIPSAEAVLSSNETDWQIANRVSHFFNLTGPSIAVNSACSGSLTAIHLACESLKQQNCSMAIAGGINLTLDPSKYEALQRINFLGSGNQSKSFGISDGYLPGEGVGAVLLKPLSAAVADHNRIYAVIRNSFINHSGGRQMYTAPDPKQQAQLIINSIQRAGIDPETIGYVESAANGSELGDSVEVVALNNAFRHFTDKKQYCALGSVKSNLGHLEAASGISQLSKVILQLKHQTLAPSINAYPRNPNITLEGTAFYLQEETKPWNPVKDHRTGNNLPRRSLINSFGAGGAYANLVIEEYVAGTLKKEPNNSISKEYLLVFSAKTQWSLSRYFEKIQAFLVNHSFVALRDMGSSLLKINHDLEYRVAILGSTLDDLMKKITRLQTTANSLVDSGIFTSWDQSTHIDITNGPHIQQFLDQKNLRQLAQLWTAGATIDLRQLYGDLETSWLDIPKYAFEHNLEFDFQCCSSTTLEITAFDDDDRFYLELSRRIANGEFTEDEVAEIIFSN